MSVMTAEEWESSTDFEAMRGALDINQGTRKWRRAPGHQQRPGASTGGAGQAAVDDRNRVGSLLGAACPTDIMMGARDQVPASVGHVLRGAGRGTDSALLFSHLIREIFLSPFRPVEIEPAWLRWSDGAVRRVAETIKTRETSPASRCSPTPSKRPAAPTNTSSPTCAAPVDLILALE
jgi:hypothetical protein